jgi:hypothetical protein
MEHKNEKNEENSGDELENKKKKRLWNDSINSIFFSVKTGKLKKK